MKNAQEFRKISTKAFEEKHPALISKVEATISVAAEKGKNDVFFDHADTNGASWDLQQYLRFHGFKIDERGHVPGMGDSMFIIRW